MVVFLGDSFTEGSCSDYSFADEFADSINLGVSGTTMGEYSIYPVDGHSLLSVIKQNEDKLKQADVIFLEYGINDTSAIMCGFADERKVIVSFVKAIDWLSQINPEANIFFLTLSNYRSIINLFASKQCDYLMNDYFKGYNFQIPENLWSHTYQYLIDEISKKVNVLYMFDDFETNLLAEDKLHPNNEGHNMIAHNITKQLYSLQPENI